jgi:hypothetical protein
MRKFGYPTTMDSSLPSTPLTKPLRTFALALLIVSPFMVFAFTYFLPPAEDFLDAFWPAAHIPLHPYNIPKFLNPPWVALLLYPLTPLPERIVQAFIAFLNMAITLLLVARFGGNRWSFILTVTSSPFLSLLFQGNIDFLPMAAFLIPPNWGLALMLSKPQVGIMSGLIWFKQARNKVLFLIPAVALLLISFTIWGWWVPGMLQQTLNSSSRSVGPWNISPFPWLVPVGFLLLYYAWELEDELIAVAATLCLVPYFAAYSLTAMFAMLAARNPRAGFIAWVVLWGSFLFLRWAVIQFYIH